MNTAAGLTVLLAAMAAAPGGAAEDSDARLARRIEWFRDQKLGFFVHWGAYSQWGCIESWPLVEEDKWARPDDLPAWVERDKDIERFRRDYWTLPRTFNPTRFDPKAWAEVTKQAGMRYFVFTTKHHDGFSMYDTRLTDYRISGPDCPFHRSPHPDVTAELFRAFREAGFGIGVYYSKADWHSPYYWSPDAPARTRNPNYDTAAHPERWAKFVEFVHGQIEELMSRYGRVDILWLDAGQVRPPQQDLQMDDLAAMARRHQPDLIVVDRTVGGKHENYRTPEQEVPDKPLDYPWESCITLGDQWSYKPHDRYKSPSQVIHLLVDIVAKGGNLLLNVGPQPDGELPAEAVSRLRELGEWMQVNGEAIYATRPVPPYKEGKVAFTRKGRNVYAVYLCGEGEEAPPATLSFAGPAPKPGSSIRLLGVKEPLRWRREGAQTVVEIPASVQAKPPCRHAYCLRLEVE